MFRVEIQQLLGEEASFGLLSALIYNLKKLDIAALCESHRCKRLVNSMRVDNP